MLLLDRFIHPDRSALDLATGLSVRLRLHARPTETPILARRAGWRLIDAGHRSPRVFVEAWVRCADAPIDGTVPIEAVRAALLDARDGCPRAVDLQADNATQWRAMELTIAREARLAGFVPIAVGVLGEILRASRWEWPRWLADRSLVILTCDGQVPAPGAVALLRLAQRDARPHLVVRAATRAITAVPRLVPMAGLVHEVEPDAGCELPSAGALAEQAWQRADAGRADEATAALARWAVMLSPAGDAELSARAALAVALVAQGRTLEARAALPSTPVSPPGAIAAGRLARAAERVREAEQPRRGDRALADDFLRVLEACQGVEDERTTIARVLALVRDRAAAATAACVVEEHGQIRVIAVLGGGSVNPGFVRPVLTSGVPSPPRGDAGPTEGAWPIRYAGAVVGALWCRWSSGHAVRPDDAGGLLQLAAVALAPAVQAAAETGRAQAPSHEVPELVGDSDAMRALRAAVVRAARSPFPVLIEGESGSGKELVARAIHRTSARRDRCFAALNCAALGEELAEAELFGHARGAFTGAVADRAGLFEEATGGTLFLDEVSELSPRIQAKLLRVLQEHEVRRLGESHVRPIDTRIVAATNRPLDDEVQAGRFRRDLRYRLDVVRLAVPPLRERLEDVPVLVRHIWAGLTAKTGSKAVLTPGAMAALGRYDWPGNVRELQNVLASLIVSSPGRGSVAATHLPAHVGRSAVLGEARSLAAARRAFDARYVKAALARAGGRASAAARELGVSRQGLAKLVTRLGLREPSVGRAEPLRE